MSPNSTGWLYCFSCPFSETTALTVWRYRVIVIRQHWDTLSLFCCSDLSSTIADGFKVILYQTTYLYYTNVADRFFDYSRPEPFFLHFLFTPDHQIYLYYTIMTPFWVWEIWIQLGARANESSRFIRLSSSQGYEGGCFSTPAFLPPPVLTPVWVSMAMSENDQ